MARDDDLFTRLIDVTSCDLDDELASADGVVCSFTIEPEEMYDDPADAAQLAAGEEDQSAGDWEGA